MVLALKFLFRIPYLCYVHGEDINTARESRELTWLVRQVLRGAKCLIANSQNTANLLLQDWSIPSEKVRILHPGVDIARFIPAARDEQTRARLGWQGRRVVLIVGRLQRRKGQDQMILAVALLRERLPEFTRGLTEKMLTYALGRGVETEDMPLVRALAREGEERIACWIDVFLTQKFEPRGMGSQKIITRPLYMADPSLLTVMETVAEPVTTRTKAAASQP